MPFNVCNLVNITWSTQAQYFLMYRLTPINVDWDIFSFNFYILIMVFEDEGMSFNLSK